MKGKKANKTQKRRTPTSRAIRERDSIPWKYCLLTLVCGSFLVVGFFGAARQHFASIDYGIKNSKLRKEIKDLEDEQKRLIFAREMAYSPAEIKKAAKKFGFVENSPKFAETFTATKISDTQTEIDKSENAGDKDEKTKTEDKPKIEKSAELKKKDEDKKSPVKSVKKVEKSSTDKNVKDKEPKKSKSNKSKDEDKKTTTRDRKVSTED